MKRYWVLMAVLLAGAAWALPKMPAGEMLSREMMLEQARTVGRDVAPDASTLTLGQARYIEYRPDGTDMSWVDFWVKALTEVGAQELRDVPVPFRKGFAECEFQLAEIIRADGTVETINLAANVHEATENGDMAANIYDDKSRQIILTVPAMAVGDTLHVLIGYHAMKTRMANTFSESLTLEQMNEPLLYGAITVVAPKDLPLKSTAILREVPGTVTQSQEKRANGDIVHRWVARNVPATFKEAEMPDERSQLQHVSFSTFESWEEISKWYWGLCVPHMETTPAIDAKVKELTDGKSKDEQIEALFGFVAQEVRYMGIIAEDDAPGYEPHDVSLTFDNRYGVCRDKGALLVAMLRKAGFNAFPVLINAGSKRAPEVPIPYFNHAIVAIDMGNRDYRLMDPTDDTARAELPGYLSDCTYVVCRPEGETQQTSPVPPANDNLLEVVSVGTLDAAGTLTYTATMTCGGMNDNVYRPLLVKYTQDELHARFDGIVKRLIPGAELVTFSYTPKDAQDISQPVVITIEARAEHYAVPNAEGKTLVTLPFFSKGVGLVNYLFRGLDQPKRKYDWEIAAPCAVQETLTLRGFDTLGTPSLLPEDPVFKANGASYDVTCRKEADGSYVLKRHLELSQKTYSPEDYLSLRRFVERFTRAESIRPLFVQTMSRDSNAIVRAKHLKTTLNPDGTVTRRNVLDMEILTFQGKRDFGEVKLSYTPARQKFTLNAAEVTTAKGDTVSVTEKEINEMDQTGAALAPRYPFAKEYIISLPGIDVGSVSHVDWTIETLDPRPFAESVTFAAGEPIVEQSYTLTTPLALEGDLRIAERNFANATVTRTVEQVGDMMVRTWTLRDIAALPDEPGMPGANFFCPTLYISTKTAAAHRVIPNVIATTQALPEDPTESIELAAEELFADLDEEDLDAHLRAVQQFLARRIRTLGPAWQSLPFGTFTPPAQVLKEGYANRMDRLLLQQALLAEAEIETELVFASDLSLQGAYVYRDVLALMEVPNWTRWTTPYLRLADGRLLGDEGEFGEPGSTSLSTRSLMTAKGRVIYQQPETLRSRTLTTKRIILDAEGNARITEMNEIYGLPAGAIRREKRDETPEAYRRKLASMAEALAIGATPFALYKVNDADYPVKTRFTVEAKRFAPRQEGLLSVPLKGMITPLYNLRGAQRVTPIAQKETPETSSVLELWLPKGVTILSKPEPFEITLPGGGHYTLTCETSVRPVSGHTILKYTTTFSAAPALLPSWQFPALLELDRRLTAPEMNTLILQLPE